MELRGRAIKPSAFLMYKEIGTFLPFINHSISGKQFEACVGNLAEYRILGDTSAFLFRYLMATLKEEFQYYRLSQSGSSPVSALVKSYQSCAAAAPACASHALLVQMGRLMCSGCGLKHYAFTHLLGRKAPYCTAMWKQELCKAKYLSVLWKGRKLSTWGSLLFYFFVCLWGFW